MINEKSNDFGFHLRKDRRLMYFEDEKVNICVKEIHLHTHIWVVYKYLLTYVNIKKKNK